MELRKLSLQDGQEVVELLNKFEANENGFMNPAFQLTSDQLHDFLQKKVEESEGINLREGYVPQTIYWLVEDSQLVGIGKLRTQLSENLKKMGGHIGYAIEPASRNKGYGTQILKLMLDEASKQGIQEVLITCDSTNERSRSVIESNGGVLADIIDHHCRYWVKQ